MPDGPGTYKKPGRPTKKVKERFKRAVSEMKNKIKKRKKKNSNEGKTYQPIPADDGGSENPVGGN